MIAISAISTRWIRSSGAIRRTHGSTPSACGAQDYAYAGLQSAGKAHGIAATITALTTPTVDDGHVAGWIGVGGVDAGPGGAAEWLQVGYASFSPDPTIKCASPAAFTRSCASEPVHAPPERA